MTTDAGMRTRGAGRVLRSLGILVGITVGWFAVLVTATLAFGPVGQTVLVIGAGVPARLPAGAGIFKASGPRTVVYAPDAAAVRRLYAHGAWLVLPALRNGCMDLRAI